MEDKQRGQKHAPLYIFTWIFILLSFISSMKSIFLYPFFSEFGIGYRTRFLHQARNCILTAVYLTALYNLITYTGAHSSVHYNSTLYLPKEKKRCVFIFMIKVTHYVCVYCVCVRVYTAATIYRIFKVSSVPLIFVAVRQI